MNIKICNKVEKKIKDNDKYDILSRNLLIEWNNLKKNLWFIVSKINIIVWFIIRKTPDSKDPNINLAFFWLN